jgi:hypothetical protein
VGYTRDWTKQELINIILAHRGENIGGANPDGSLTYLQLGKHPLMKKSKDELKEIAHYELAIRPIICEEPNRG